MTKKNERISLTNHSRHSQRHSQSLLSGRNKVKEVLPIFLSWYKGTQLVSMEYLFGKTLRASQILGNSGNNILNILLQSSFSMPLLVIELKIFDCGSEFNRLILIIWTASRSTSRL